MRRFAIRLIIMLFIMAGFTLAFAAEGTNLSEQPHFGVFNTLYLYNGENGGYNTNTRFPNGYFEDLIQPYMQVKLNPITSFKVGVGLLIPFDQESKVLNYWPVVQVKIKPTDEFTVIGGTLEDGHNYPSCMLDPMVNFVPQLRDYDANQIPNPDNESYPQGIMSHGFYEYGLQTKWDFSLGKGECYINWQLPNTQLHRERFDIGFIESYTAGIFPLYLAYHYWHNGEDTPVHPIDVTENHNIGLGLRDTNFSLLYVSSIYFPNREAYPGEYTYGQGLYADYHFRPGDWDLQPEFFISDTFIDKTHWYMAVEGDPFYRVPLYLGFNIFYNIKIFDDTAIKIGLVNGTFLPTTDATWYWRMIRYDQEVKIDINYTFK